MAGEIQLTAAIKFANNTLVDNVPSNTIAINQNTQGFDAQTPTVPNTQTNADLSGVGTLGFVRLQNLSLGTDLLEYGPISGTTYLPMGWLYPGEWAILRLKPGTTLRWVANSNAVKVLLKAYAD